MSDDDTTQQDFDEAVNMTAEQRAEWLDTEESNAVGQDDGGQSAGHLPGPPSTDHPRSDRGGTSTTTDEHDNRSTREKEQQMGLSKGTKVTWNTPQGETEGKVVEKKTEDFELDGRTYRASSDDPHYIVESDSSGARATHKAEALTEK